MIREASTLPWGFVLPAGVLGTVFGAALWSGLGAFGALVVAFVVAVPFVAIGQYRRNAAQMAAPIRIWDTRRGDDLSALRADAPRLLAGVTEPVAVVDTIGFDWAPHAALLEQILGAPDTEPFVLCDAWVPGAKRTLAAVAAAFPVAAANDDRLRTRPPGLFVSDALTVRQHTGGHASGTWIIGACTSLEALQAALARDAAEHGYTPFPAAVAAFEHLAGALCLDELYTTLIVRIRPGAAAVVDELLAQVQAGRPA